MKLKATYTFLVTCLFFVALPLYARASGESVGRVASKSNIIGVSLPEQRSRRWVRDRDVFYQYSKLHNIDIRIRFSDNDKYLQSYQIKSLVNEGITTLILAAPMSNELNLALEYAKSKDVYIIVYESLIQDSYAVDFYVGFNLNNIGLTNLKDNFDIQAVQEVVSGKKEYTWLTDSSLLAEKAVELAVEFFENKPRINKFEEIDNGSRTLLSVLLQPTKITKDNYQQYLLDGGMTTERELGLEE